MAAAAFPRKLGGTKDLKLMLSFLRAGFPLAQYMWQVVKDVTDRKLDANFYTDRWPDFSTIISQEYTPRLSMVADLRIYSTEKERIPSVLEENNLLSNIGSWQLIHYVTGKENHEDFSSYLMDVLQCHPNTKEKTSKLIFDYSTCSVGLSALPNIPVPSGFHLKCIPEDTAEYLATHWHVANIEYPFECRVRFLKDAISRYGMLGLYSEKDDKYPVSWAGIKPGGAVGLAYTFKEYRHRKMSALLCGEVTRQTLMEGNIAFGETKEDNVSEKRGYEETGGRSQIIAIY